MDLGLPTNNGMTIKGNTTTSRNGNTGMVCNSDFFVLIAYSLFYSANLALYGDDFVKFKI